MNKEEFKILNYLSDNLGSGENISNIFKEISKKYSSTYYTNIYNSVARLEKKGVISIIVEGNNRLIKLNIKSPISIYYISEAENHKTIDIKISKEIINILLDLALNSNIITISVLKYDDYIKINRIELLIIERSHNQD
ncbi:MAG: hypothetical protein ACP5T6_02960, partial [Candidatus Micrarchaeia archaeon]